MTKERKFVRFIAEKCKARSLTLSHGSGQCLAIDADVMDFERMHKKLTTTSVISMTNSKKTRCWRKGPVAFFVDDRGLRGLTYLCVIFWSPLHCCGICDEGSRLESESF